MFRLYGCFKIVTSRAQGMPRSIRSPARTSRRRVQKERSPRSHAYEMQQSGSIDHWGTFHGQFVVPDRATIQLLLKDHKPRVVKSESSIVISSNVVSTKTVSATVIAIPTEVGLSTTRVARSLQGPVNDPPAARLSASFCKAAREVSEEYWKDLKALHYNVQAQMKG